MNSLFQHIILYIVAPLLFVAAVLYGLLSGSQKEKVPNKYQVRFKLNNGNFKIDNIRLGASIIGSAGSGKTESVVYNFLQPFSQHGFCGVIHDYKDFELTEILNLSVHTYLKQNLKDWPQSKRMELKYSFIK